MLDLKNFKLFHVRPEATKRLLIFHHAGGSSGAYFKWSRLAPAEVEVYVAELPGRAKRHAEAFATNIPDYIRYCWNEIEFILQKPTIIMGHSMGSLLAFETAKTADSKNIPYKTLVVSAFLPPTQVNLQNRRKISDKSEQDLFNFMLKFGSIPPELINNKEARNFYLPILRADLALFENYPFPGNIKLKKLLHPMVGMQDPSVSVEGVANWNEFNQTPQPVKTFDGDHFYLLKAPQPVIDFVCTL